MSHLNPSILYYSIKEWQQFRSFSEGLRRGWDSLPDSAESASALFQIPLTYSANKKIRRRVFIYWRRGWDLNPRSRLRDTRFPSGRTRPLCDPSKMSISY